MRLAIVAAPPLALTLLSIATLEIALHRPTARPRDPYASSSPPEGCWVLAPDLPAPPTCSTAHSLVVHGHISGGASHVKLAGPILYTDVATDLFGDFQLRVPVDGNVCDLLAQPTSYAFGDDVRYSIAFE